MSDKDTLAFPYDGTRFVKEQKGMLLRDYFAAKALAALIAATDQGDLAHHLGACDAYRYADAMLKARG